MHAKIAEMKEDIKILLLGIVCVKVFSSPGERYPYAWNKSFVDVTTACWEKRRKRKKKQEVSHFYVT